MFKRKKIILLVVGLLITVGAIFWYWSYQNENNPPSIRRQPGSDFPVLIRTVEDFNKKPWPNVLLGFCWSPDKAHDCDYGANIKTDASGQAKIFLRRNEVMRPEAFLGVFGMSANGGYGGRPISGEITIELLPWLGR